MVAALKESGAALGSPIATVSVTALWVAVWSEDIPVDSAVHDVLGLLGSPGRFEATWPIYLGEALTVLAANGRQYYKERWCGYSMSDDGEF
jgi:hypothetical protein